MKLLAVYQDLKKQSVSLLTKGHFDAYFESLMQLSKLEKEMQKLILLN